ncbi:response regulator transcription factor [Sphingomonas sp. So64.6b]|uniref:response regulator n=1 Tax=Sphingomonas sp. So64.6b TaxID=2997354 RepID=UPI0016004C97|nr:response regulator transcription factor [Sphingomonas sp. So64.6b]QNA82981.1 response regulator transcription factor [Sphingomonas sp. So64.6b]
MRLLIVEDDQPLATLLAQDLAALGHESAIIDNGREAFSLVAQDAFDGIVVDRMLIGNMDGVAVIRWLRDAKIETPIVMLTAYGTRDEKIEGLNAGADDYLVKPVDAAELEARFRAIMRRPTNSLQTGILRAGDIEINVPKHRVWRSGQAIELQKQEFKLLAELVRNADGVMTRAMLIETIWGYDFDPKAKIVDSYIKRLRDALCADGLADPIETVRGVGYMIRS